MLDFIERDRLPSSVLGDNRCFEIGYFGHGDIIVSTWQGELDHKPTHNDGISRRFGFAHSGDSVILAALSGYLMRSGYDKDNVGKLLLDAGHDILADGAESLKYKDLSRVKYLGHTILGRPMESCDEKSLDLKCLVPPTPSRPGIIEETGGTAIYTSNNTGRQLLVFGRHDPGEPSVSTLKYAAEFCEQDVPVMARLVCNLALGEYREDIHALLAYHFTNDLDDVDH
jgi:hypothetical protein